LKSPKVEEKMSEEKIKFALKRIWWRGQIVIRALPEERFYLLLDRGKPALDVFQLEANPFFADMIPSEREEWTDAPPDGKTTGDWLEFEGILKPKHRLNPNKKLNANVQTIDSGEVLIIEETEYFLHLDFAGKKFKGRRALKREAPDSPIWVFEKSKWASN